MCRYSQRQEVGVTVPRTKSGRFSFTATGVGSGNLTLIL